MTDEKQINLYFIFDFFLNNTDFRLTKIKNYLKPFEKNGSLDKSHVSKIINFSVYYMNHKLTFDYLVKSYISRDIQIKKNLFITQKILSLTLAMAVFQKNFESAFVEFRMLIRQYQNSPFISAIMNAFDRYFMKFGFDMPPIKIKDRIKEMSVLYSCPAELCEFMCSELSCAEAAEVFSCMQQPLGATFRINRIVLRSCAEIKKFLETFSDKYGVSVTPVFNESEFLYSVNKNSFMFDITEKTEFKEGFITPMGISAYLGAKLLAPEDGDLILDACASPGNKTCHIAEESDCQAKIIAVDVSKSKVDKIADNAARLKLNNIFAVEGNSDVLNKINIAENIKSLAGADDELFDKMLVDVPCSGLGTLRSRVDLKYRFTPKDTEKMPAIQYGILSNVSKMLKKGGSLIYSTCTINRRENTELIKKFVAQHPEFKIMPLDNEFEKYEKILKYKVETGCIQIIPDSNGAEGFFYARLKKE